MEEINWISVLAAACMPLLIGSVWYRPGLFGRFRDKPVQLFGGGKRPYKAFMIFAASVLIAIFLYSDINFGGGSHGMPQSQTFGHGAWHGSFYTVLIALPIILVNTLIRGKKIRYILITTGFWWVSLLIMGGIVSLWH